MCCALSVQLLLGQFVHVAYNNGVAIEIAKQPIRHLIQPTARPLQVEVHLHRPDQTARQRYYSLWARLAQPRPRLACVHAGLGSARDETAGSPYLEGGHGVAVADLDAADASRLLVRAELQIDKENTAAEAARLAVGHGDDVGGNLAGQIAGNEHFAAFETCALRFFQFVFNFGRYLQHDRLVVGDLVVRRRKV